MLLIDFSMAPSLSELTSLSQGPSLFIHPLCEYEKKIRYVLALSGAKQESSDILLNIAWVQLSIN